MKLNLDQKQRDIQKVMKLAGAPDPDAALSAEREAAQKRMEEIRRTKNVLHLVERLMKLNLDQWLS